MHQILLVLQYIADNLFKYSVFSGKGIVSAITDRCLIISSSSSSSHSRLPLPLKQEGPFSSRNATVKRIVTSCSLSLHLSSLCLSLSLPLAALFPQAAEPELYIRSGLMSGSGTFSHIYQDELLIPSPSNLLFYSLCCLEFWRDSWLRLHSNHSKTKKGET